MPIPTRMVAAALVAGLSPRRLTLHRYRIHALLVGLVGFVFIFILASVATDARAVDRLPTLKSCERVLPKSEGQFVAYFNPRTGKLTSAPHDKKSGMPLRVEDLYPFTTLHAGLTTKRTDDGLVMLDMKGRFQHGSIAIVDEQGITRVIRIGGEIFHSEAGRCMLSQILHDKSIPIDR